jgi:hypothetical protein
VKISVPEDGGGKTGMKKSADYTLNKHGNELKGLLHPA